MLLVVDQPATIGAPPVAVARAEGIAVAYLPGHAMRRIADLHAGEAKKDARDAYIIAEAARSLPHTLESLKLADNGVAELAMLCGLDDDLSSSPCYETALFTARRRQKPIDNNIGAPQPQRQECGTVVDAVLSEDARDVLVSGEGAVPLDGSDPLLRQAGEQAPQHATLHRVLSNYTSAVRRLLDKGEVN